MYVLEYSRPRVIWNRFKMFTKWLPNAYVVLDGRLFFQSIHIPGGGVPHLHLHPIKLPLVPCSFVGVSHDGVPPSQLRMGGTHDGVPPSRDWVPPARLGQGGTHNGGTPWSQWGTPPGWDSRWSTWYAAVGMPLAFTQEDFLVITCERQKQKSVKYKKCHSDGFIPQACRFVE